MYIWSAQNELSSKNITFLTDLLVFQIYHYFSGAWIYIYISLSN